MTPGWLVIAEQLKVSSNIVQLKLSVVPSNYHNDRNYLYDQHPAGLPETPIWFVKSVFSDFSGVYFLLLYLLYPSI